MNKRDSSNSTNRAARWPPKAGDRSQDGTPSRTTTYSESLLACPRIPPPSSQPLEKYVASPFAATSCADGLSAVE